MHCGYLGAGASPCLLMNVRGGSSKECAGYMVLRERMYVISGWQLAVSG